MPLFYYCIIQIVTERDGKRKRQCVSSNPFWQKIETRCSWEDPGLGKGEWRSSQLCCRGGCTCTPSLFPPTSQVQVDWVVGAPGDFFEVLKAHKNSPSSSLCTPPVHLPTFAAASLPVPGDGGAPTPLLYDTARLCKAGLSWEQ